MFSLIDLFVFLSLSLPIFFLFHFNHLFSSYLLILIPVYNYRPRFFFFHAFYILSLFPFLFVFFVPGWLQLVGSRGGGRYAHGGCVHDTWRTRLSHSTATMNAKFIFLYLAREKLNICCNFPADVHKSSLVEVDRSAGVFICSAPTGVDCWCSISSHIPWEDSQWLVEEILLPTHTSISLACALCGNPEHSW